MKPIPMLLAAALIGTAPLAPAAAQQTARAEYSVGPQYDTTHVYVAPDDFDRFVASLVATFGGTTSKQGVFQVTPTASQTISQLVLTPVGTVSVFGFKTPIPYPFGTERTGYLVSDMDAALVAALKAGATRLVTIFPDPIGRELTGYEVADLDQTLAKAIAAGVETLVAAHADGDRRSSIVRFPGGYIAEVHASARP